jgi:hypothetical protein
VIIAIPMLVATLYSFWMGDWESSIFALFIFVISIGLFGLAIHFLLFRTNWVIDKLHLDKGLQEEPIPLNVHRSTAISIALLIVGLLLLIHSIPPLIGSLIKWYQYVRATRGIASFEPFDYSNIVNYTAQIVIGYFVIQHQNILTNFIERNQRTRTSQTSR